MKRAGISSRKISLLTPLLVIFLLAPVLSARSYEFEDKFSYDVEEGFQLTIENRVGTVVLMPSQDSRLNVLVIKEVRASSSDEAAEIKDDIDVVIDAAPNDVAVRTHYSDHSSGRSFWKEVFGIGGSNTSQVHLEIEVPVSVRLLVNTTSADLSARNLEGEFRFELSSGDLRLSHLNGRCQIETTSGDIEVRDVKGDVSVNASSSDNSFDNIEGDLELEATSGDTEIKWVSGRVRVDKSSGDTRIDKTSGDLEINSTSGDIWVVQRSGNFWLKTSSGDIHIESEMQDGVDFEVSTTSGDITLRFPQETSADILAETVSGEIDADAKIEMISLGRKEFEGRVGKGDKRLRLSSSSGDIHLVAF